MSSNSEKISHLPEPLTKGVYPASDRTAGVRSREVRSLAKDPELIEQRYKEELLAEPWIARNGHGLTFIGLMLFTILLFYRPYEFSGSLLWLNSMVFPVAIGTLAVYAPSQFYLENRPTIWTTEVKLLLAFIGLALITVPISKNPAVSLTEVTDGLSRIVLIFIIFVNALRTKKRWNILAITLVGVGIMLSYQTIGLYRSGVFNTEGYRVSRAVGMLANPNEMSLFLVLLIPTCLSLGFVSANLWIKACSFLATGFMGVAVLLTQSRTGFLGMGFAAGIMVWKLGRKNRIKVFLVAAVFGFAILLFAPGNYGVRILSIFDSNLDPVGSSSERSDLLKRSLVVSIRNPQGVGIGNSPSFGYRNLQTHNSFTQVSSELGIIGIVIYIAILICPLRKLSKIEKLASKQKQFRSYQILSVGMQASICGYMITSFFASVAYQWYMYYAIILAVGLRRLFVLELGSETVEPRSLMGEGREKK